MRHAWIVGAVAVAALGVGALWGPPLAAGANWKAAYESLSDSDPAIRDRAIQTLVDQGASIIPTLSTSLSQEDSPLVLHGIVKVLATIGLSESEVVALRPDLLGGRPATRRAVVGLVGATRPAVLAAELRWVARHRAEVADVRHLAALALGRVGSSEHDVLYALATSKDEAPAQRAGFLAGLVRTGGAGREDVLALAASATAERELVEAAWQALSAGDVPVLTDLLELLTHNEPRVRARAAAALLARQETSDDAVDALAERLAEDDDPTVRRAALLALHASGKATRAMSAILGGLGDESVAVRSLAARIEAEVLRDGTVETVEALVDLLSDATFHVRYEASLALAHLGDDRGAAPMAEDARSADPIVSATAGAAVSRIQSLTSGTR